MRGIKFDKKRIKTSGRAGPTKNWSARPKRKVCWAGRPVSRPGREAPSVVKLINIYSKDIVVFVPLLRRMTHLEKLTFYLRISYRNTFINVVNL